MTLGLAPPFSGVENAAVFGASFSRDFSDVEKVDVFGASFSRHFSDVFVVSFRGDVNRSFPSFHFTPQGQTFETERELPKTRHKKRIRTYG